MTAPGGGADVIDSVEADSAADVGGSATDAAADTAVDAGGDTPGDILGRHPPCQGPADCGAAPDPCQRYVCDSKLGCVLAALPEGALCLDGDPCSVGAACTEGACKPVGQKDCDDGDPCTDDSCKAGACAHLPAAATPIACDDGDACTLGDACVGGVCAPGAAICLCQTDADCQGKGVGADGKTNLCLGT